MHADLGLALAKQAWLARSRSAPRRHVGDARRRERCRRISMAVRSSTCPAAYPLEMRYAPGVPLPRRWQRACASARDRSCAFSRAPARSRGRAGKSRDAGATDVEVVELHGSLDCGGAGRGDRRHAAPAHHPRHQHRRDVAHRSGRHRGHRQRLAEGGALRSRSRGRQPRDRADLPGRGRSARGPRRPARARPGDPAVAPGRSPPRRIASRRSSASISPARCSTSWRGAAIRARSNGSRRRPPDRVDAALELLERLGATSAGRLTDAGRRMQRLPLNPRLSAILLAAGRRARGGRSPARCCRSVIINPCRRARRRRRRAIC